MDNITDITGQPANPTKPKTRKRKSTPPHPRSLTAVFQRIGCGRTKGYALINSGKLKVHKIGASSFVTEESEAEFFASLPAYQPRKASE